WFTDSAALKTNGVCFGCIFHLIEFVLKVLKDGLSALDVSYANVFPVKLLTVIVKIAIFALTKPLFPTFSQYSSLDMPVSSSFKRASNSKGQCTEGSFWIPSLGGPTTVAARQCGSVISWLIPFVGDEALDEAYASSASNRFLIFLAKMKQEI
ncbi:hypothetical protein Godav_008297, partial [Gossypium davidsonii]|nr:hypothetical protein [Gossypium davidsonii]MBA0658318.1 hypothetical protein [Gossypium klotzschianum]